METSPERINVLQVMDKCAIRGSPIHGVSRLLLYWWTHFRETDFNFSLCVLRGGHGTCKPFSEIGVEVLDLDRSKIDPRTVLDLIRLIKREKIDILHCHGYGATTFGRIAGLLSGTPVLVHEHMVDENIPLYQKLVDRLLAPFTAKGIAISKAVATFMTGPRAIRQASMEVVYNTIPAEFCREYTPDEKEGVRKMYGIPDNVTLIGMVGRLDPVKGYTDFLQAAVIISKAYPESRFIIVGDGELRDTLEQQAESADIRDKVLFLGHCNNVLAIVSLLDVFVSASHSEGFGMAIAEAMAQKKPVVATSVGGVPELIEDSTSGLLVKPGSPDELAAAIIRILGDNVLKGALGENALSRIRGNFMVQRTVEELGRIYRDVLR